MKRIADQLTAIKSLDEAKAVMRSLAELECRIACSAAQTEKQIAAAKARHEDRCAIDVRVVGELEQRLSSFILANPGLFRSPRKVVTEHGSFGLQHVTEVEICDADVCIEYLVECGHEACLKTARTPVKSKLKEHLEANEAIPGCQLASRDTAVYKVHKALLDAEREKVLG